MYGAHRRSNEESLLRLHTWSDSLLDLWSWNNEGEEEEEEGVAVEAGRLASSLMPNLANWMTSIPRCDQDTTAVFQAPRLLLFLPFLVYAFVQYF